MKRIIFLFILVLSLPNMAFCQSCKDEFFILEEYQYDEEGKPIIIPADSIEYYRITNKDYSAWGFKNKKGEIIIPPGKYSFLNDINKYGMIYAEKEGKEGYIDITEKVLIPFIYDKVGAPSDNVELISVIKNGKQGFVNYKGEIVIALEYDGKPYSAAFFHPEVAILTKNGRYGVIDSKNNVIIPFEYDNIRYSNEMDYFIVTKGKEWATFSFDGKQLSKFDNSIIIQNRNRLPSYMTNLPLLITAQKNEENIDYLFMDINYRNGTKRIRDSIEISIGGEFSYIDKAKQIIVPYGIYDYAKPFGLGRNAIVAKKWKYGIINEYGKIVLPLNYDYIERFSQYSPFNDIFLATQGQTVTVFDKNVRKLPVKDITSYLYEDNKLYISDIHGKKGLLDYFGTQTIPFKYDTLYASHNLYTTGFIAKKEGMYGFISEKDEIIQPFIYRDIYTLKDGLVFVNTDNKAGMFDKNWNIKLAFEYDSICDTYYNNFEPEEAKYIVIKNGKVGTVDIHNKTVIPIMYDALSGWVEYGPEAHFALKDGKYGLISHTNQIIIPFEYDYIGLPKGGVIVVSKNGKYGALSWENKEILPCKYDFIINDMPIEDIGDKRAPKLIVLLNNTWNYYDGQGEIIRKDVPKEIIMGNYGYILEWGTPSNENPDFSMKHAKSNSKN